jgi:hypothetical protein
MVEDLGLERPTVGVARGVNRTFSLPNWRSSTAI